ncbi:MAG: hypothetical protein ACUVXA_08390 [Candidatus Jordarchaeum sp.]|uniref:hypothetical protein n=1 Tax=Candidatus Jordarchaeum sp. TaxID=2823881 RepID=UPI004049EC8D
MGFYTGLILPQPKNNICAPEGDVEPRDSAAACKDFLSFFLCLVLAVFILLV